MRHTRATKLKLSAMRKGKNNPFYGKHHTAKTKQKLARITRRFNLNRTYDINLASVKIPTGLERGYLCGLIDGEGSIRFRGRGARKFPFVAIYNTDARLMRWLKVKTGITAKPTDHRGGRLPVWHWLLQSAANVYLICCELEHLLIVKKFDAQKVVAFLREKYGKRIVRAAYHG